MSWVRAALLAILALQIVALPSTGSAQQVVCEESPHAPPEDLGTPGQDGTTVETTLEAVGDQAAYRFRVPEASTAYVYVGDQWYDLDLALWYEFRAFACWRVRGISERHERRVLQLIRPDEQILESLDPGDYTLVAQAADTSAFDPSRGSTIRVALGPPLCGSLEPPNVPNPEHPGLLMRAEDALYQLGLSIEPRERLRGPFSLLTLNAFLSPPYTDLFDFEWGINGMAVDGHTGPTLQVAASELLQVNRVQLTAHGVREYPDPDQPHLPPTLSVECTFRVGA